MSEKINICSRLKLQWTGIFHLEELYKKMKFWLDFNGYGDEKNNFIEERYVERIKGPSKQLEVKWIGEKLIDDYFSILFTIDFLILGLKEVEVQKEGRKIKMNSGTVIIYFNSDLVTNRQNKYKDSGFFKKFYENVLIRSSLENHQKAAYSKIYSFHDEVKSYLELLRY